MVYHLHFFVYLEDQVEENVLEYEYEHHNHNDQKKNGRVLVSLNQLGHH